MYSAQVRIAKGQLTSKCRSRNRIVVQLNPSLLHLRTEGGKDIANLERYTRMSANRDRLPDDRRSVQSAKHKHTSHRRSAGVDDRNGCTKGLCLQKKRPDTRHVYHVHWVNAGVVCP